MSIEPQEHPKTKSPFFRGKSILLISPEPWSHLFVSKHHYAIALAETNNVYFLNPPVAKYSIKGTAYKNLWELSYPPFLKGLRFFPSSVQRWVMKKRFQRLEKLTGRTFDCVWSFDNSVFFDFTFLPPGVLSISHRVDHLQNFELKRAATTATFCLGVSTNLVERLQTFNVKSFLLPHGIALDEERSTMPVDLPGSNPIKVVYAGNLDSYLMNTELLFYLMDKHPKVDFIFFGSGGKAWPKKSNAHFAGVVPHNQLQHYLRKADILLLVYDSETYPDQLTNAHKVLEYLNSGRVIVTTYLSDYATTTDLLQMARTSREMPLLFAEVLANLTFYNSKEKAEKRMAFARQNTYAKRLQEVESLIQRVFEK